VVSQDLVAARVLDARNREVVRIERLVDDERVLAIAPRSAI
jgi:hypothetical protein